MTASEAGQGFAPLDVITHNPGDLVRREQMRDLGAGVVQAIFRIVKLAALHAMDNQAVLRQVNETVALVNDYGLRTGTNVSILFAQGSIFVGGQLLRASRSVYDGAMELGAVLLRCGVAELTIAKDSRKQDIQILAQVIAGAMRGQRPESLEMPTPRIRLRPASDAALARGLTVERLTPDQAIVRTYASAIVIMRRLYESLARGHHYLPQRVKRVAQSLVDLSAGETPAFLGVTSSRNANHDDAGRAVNSAILTLAIARQVTSDALLLVRLAMAALLYDTARPRLTGARPGFAVLPALSEQQELEEPAATAVVLTALGRVNEPSIMRTVMVYEAHWVRRQARLGALYDGLRQPTIQARIVAVARAYSDLLAPPLGVSPMTADGAIARLEAEAVEPIERTVVRLLVGALGIFPTGSLVELSTGETALVVATPLDPALYSQPRVRLVFDAAGGVADRSVEIDLAAAPPLGTPRRHIVRVVAMADEAGPELRALATPSFAPTPSSPRAPPAPSPSSSGARALGPFGVFVKGQDPAVSSGSGAFPITIPSPRNMTPPTWRSPFALDPPGEIALRETDSADPRQSTRAVAYDRSFLTAQEGEDEARRISSLPASPPGEPAPRSSRSPIASPGPTTKLMTPTAEGNLTRTPLVHLLVYMLDQGLTGSTVFQAPNGAKHCVYFRHGIPVKIQTGNATAPLDRVILDLGVLDEPTLRATMLEVSKRRILHGRFLVTEGLITPGALLEILAEQLGRKLVSLFDLPAATAYAFFQDNNLIASYGGPELTPCAPLAAIMAGVRMQAHDPRVDQTLARFATRPLVLHIDADPRRFHLQKRERAVVDLLRAKKMTLADLLSAGVAEERIVRTTIYALAISRHLELGAGKPPIGINTPFVAPREVAPQSAPPVSHAAGAASTTLPSPSPELPLEVPPPSAPGRRTGFGMGFGLSAKATDAPSRTSAVGAAPPAEAMPIAPARAPASPPIAVAPPAAPAPIAAAAIAMEPTTAPAAVAAVARPAAPVVAAAPAPLIAVAPPAAVASGAQTVEDPRVSARRTEIETRYRSIDKSTYYEILGVNPDAKADEIQAAYFALAKAWHPDRLPAALSDMKPQLTKVFGKMSEAFQTLSDGEKRARYAETLKRGEGGQSPEESATIERVIDAALAFQKAEVLFRTHDMAGAESLARAAVSADPDQPEYLTLLVWIQAQRRGDPPTVSEGHPSSFYDDLIRSLDIVLTREPRFERALFYRGMLLKRSGRAERAMRDFRLAAEVNPKNIDAVREVRLFDMRKKAEPAQAPVKPPEGGGGGGLFGKLFKK